LAQATLARVYWRCFGNALEVDADAMTFCMPNRSHAEPSRRDQKCYCCWGGYDTESKDDLPGLGQNNATGDEHMGEDILKLTILSSGGRPAQPVFRDKDGEETRHQADYFSRDLDDMNDMERTKTKAPLRGQRVVFPSSGAEYAGEWEGYAREGMGSQRWLDGAEYCGQWSQNAANGRGSFKDPKGNIYTGEWEDSQASGLGCYVDVNQSFSYTGEWREDLPHGHGVTQLPDGTEYSGYFHHGSRHGFGILRKDGQIVYIGRWLQDEFHGKGVYYSPQGAEIHGTWSNSRLTGVARYVWPDGTMYEGEMKDGIRDGFGALTWPDGSSFKGFWIAGAMAENGRLVS